MTRGSTPADRRRTAFDKQNADVCVAVDGERFKQRFVEALTSIRTSA